MLPSAMKKSTGNIEERKSVTFSRENSLKAESEKEDSPTAERESMEPVDKFGAMTDADEVDGEIVYQDEAGEGTEGRVKSKKGKKVAPADSLKRNRQRFSKSFEG